MFLLMFVFCCRAENERLSASKSGDDVTQDGRQQISDTGNSNVNSENTAGSVEKDSQENQSVTDTKTTEQT